MDSPVSSPSVYSQSSSCPASSSLRTPSPFEPLPPVYEGPLTCLDIYHEWFSNPRDMTKPGQEPNQSMHMHHRRHLLDILADGRARRRRAPSPQSLSQTESEDPLTCVDIYREWFAQDMAKDNPAHRRRLLDILARTDGRRGPPPQSLPHPPPQSLLHPRSRSDDTYSDSGSKSSSSIHAPRPVLGWSPVSYWNDETLASWSQAAGVTDARSDPDVAPSGVYPIWDLWDKMQAHSWEMICMHPGTKSRRADMGSRDGRTEEIRRRRRILLLEELVVRCELMDIDGCSHPHSRDTHCFGLNGVIS